jgi:hypothetical protein
LLAIAAAGALVIATRTRVAVLSFASLLLVTGVRFGDEWVSPPASTPSGATIRVVTWNVLACLEPPIRLTDAEQPVRAVAHVDAALRSDP